MAAAPRSVRTGVDVSFVVRGRSRKTLLAAAVAVIVVLGVVGWAVFLRPSDSAAAGGHVPVRDRHDRAPCGRRVPASGTVDGDRHRGPQLPGVRPGHGGLGHGRAEGRARASGWRRSTRPRCPARWRRPRRRSRRAQAKLAADQASGASSTQLAADSASITVAQGQVSSATADLAGATITAPFAGTVTSVGYVVGQQVGGQGRPAPDRAPRPAPDPVRPPGPDPGPRPGRAAGPAPGPRPEPAARRPGRRRRPAPDAAAIHLVSTGSYEVQASVDASDVGSDQGRRPGPHHRRQRDPERLRHRLVGRHRRQHDVRGGVVPGRGRGDRQPGRRLPGRDREPADRLQATVQCAPGADAGDQPGQRSDDRARAERRQAGTPDDHDRAHLGRRRPRCSAGSPRASRCSSRCRPGPAPAGRTGGPGGSSPVAGSSRVAAARSRGGPAAASANGGGAGAGGGNGGPGRAGEPPEPGNGP